MTTHLPASQSEPQVRRASHSRSSQGSNGDTGLELDSSREITPPPTVTPPHVASPTRSVSDPDSKLESDTDSLSGSEADCSELESDSDTDQKEEEWSKHVIQRLKLYASGELDSWPMIIPNLNPNLGIIKAVTKARKKPSQATLKTHAKDFIDIIKQFGNINSRISSNPDYIPLTQEEEKLLNTSPASLADIQKYIDAVTVILYNITSLLNQDVAAIAKSIAANQQAYSKKLDAILPLFSKIGICDIRLYRLIKLFEDFLKTAKRNLSTTIDSAVDAGVDAYASQLNIVKATLLRIAAFTTKSTIQQEAHTKTLDTINLLQTKLIALLAPINISAMIQDMVVSKLATLTKTRDILEATSKNNKVDYKSAVRKYRQALEEFFILLEAIPPFIVTTDPSDHISPNTFTLFDSFKAHCINIGENRPPLFFIPLGDSGQEILKFRSEFEAAYATDPLSQPTFKALESCVNTIHAAYKKFYKLTQQAQDYKIAEQKPSASSTPLALQPLPPPTTQTQVLEQHVANITPSNLEKSGKADEKQQVEAKAPTEQASVINPESTQPKKATAVSGDQPMGATINTSATQQPNDKKENNDQIDPNEAFRIREELWKKLNKLTSILQFMKGAIDDEGCQWPAIKEACETLQLFCANIGFAINLDKLKTIVNNVRQLVIDVPNRSSTSILHINLNQGAQALTTLINGSVTIDTTASPLERLTAHVNNILTLWNNSRWYHSAFNWLFHPMKSLRCKENIATLEANLYELNEMNQRVISGDKIKPDQDRLTSLQQSLLTAASNLLEFKETLYMPYGLSTLLQSITAPGPSLPGEGVVSSILKLKHYNEQSSSVQHVQIEPIASNSEAKNVALSTATSASPRPTDKALESPSKTNHCQL